MHEYSIVQSLLESCDAHAKKNSAKKVTKVVIKIGVLSGVEPHLLSEAFEAFKQGTCLSRVSFGHEHTKSKGALQ